LDTHAYDISKKLIYLKNQGVHESCNLFQSESIVVKTRTVVPICTCKPFSLRAAELTDVITTSFYIMHQMKRNTAGYISLLLLSFSSGLHFLLMIRNFIALDRVVAIMKYQKSIEFLV
jgi:hypothetical protein